MSTTAATGSTAAATTTAAAPALLPPPLLPATASPADKRKTQSDARAQAADAKLHESATKKPKAAPTAVVATASAATSGAGTAAASADATAPATAPATATATAATATAAATLTDVKSPSTAAAAAAPDAAAIAVDTNGKGTQAFRDYTTPSARQATVAAFYAEKNAKQTYAFVESMERKYNGGGLCEMGLWECLEYLDTFVDDSDPDTEHSQLQHALQTAEAIRAAYPGDDMDWFALTGLIHDLGKLLAPKGGERQFAVVGDTHPVGCAFAPENVFHAAFAANPDAAHPVYATPNGVYTPGCGLHAVKFSWGHDEYLYQVVRRNGTTLPPAALAIIRFHSFYAWHQAGAYRHLMNAEDAVHLQWVQAFQRFDLYSKAHTRHDPARLKPVYQKLIAKYFPTNGGVLKW